jgi:uncharacterized protein (DUF2384 family)
MEKSTHNKPKKSGSKAAKLNPSAKGELAGVQVGRYGVKLHPAAGEVASPLQAAYNIFYQTKTSGHKAVRKGVVLKTIHSEALEYAVGRLRNANPLERVAIEREGVHLLVIKGMADQMAVPARRLYTVLGLPQATANRRAVAGTRIAGASGYAAVAMLDLIGKVELMLTESTAPEAADINAAKWLGEWIERPQPSLGGSKPADLLATPTGAAVVERALGALVSGAYQ